MEEFEREESELRQIAQERQREIDALLRHQDSKLREQDLIIKAQMQKIGALDSQLAV